MINLLGKGHGDGAPLGLKEALAIDGAHVHVYGKSASRPGRKMGHVTAVGSSAEEATDRARRAAESISFGREEAVREPIPSEKRRASR